MISRLHVITQDLKHFSHVDQVIMACKNGAEWIQLRVKDTHYDKWKSIAQDAIRICREYGTKLIINDSVQIAMEIDADGVHLGRDDMPIHSARMLLGKDKIIGGTGNTFEDIVQIYESGADYAGIGPFQFTPTKKDLKNLLGAQTYREFVQYSKEREIDIPIIAIGGIKAMDVRPLFRMGIFGVAVSSAIFSAPFPESALYEFQKNVKESIENQPYVAQHS